MKFGTFLALPLLFACTFAAVAQAEDVVVTTDHHGRHEYRMRVARHGDHFVGFYNNHEYVLRGDAVGRINADGEYTVYGDIAPDNSFVEIQDARLVPAPVVVRDREVIVERERDPFIKVGPLEIGR